MKTKTPRIDVTILAELRGLRTIVDEHTVLHESHRLTFEKHGNSIELLAQFTSQNTTAIAELKTEVASLKTEVAALRAEVSALREDLERVRHSVVVIENQIGQILTLLREGMSPKVAKHEVRLDDHEVRIVDLES